MREASLAPRLLATLATGFLLTVGATTIFAWWAVGPITLRPLVVVIVSAGFRLPLLWGGLSVLALGYMNDLLSGGIIGLNVVAYMVVFIVCTIAQRKLQIDSWPLQMATVAVMSAAIQLLVASGLMLTRWDHLVPPDLYWVVAAQAVLSAFTAPLFFSFLEALVQLFSKMWPKDAGAAA